MATFAFILPSHGRNTVIIQYERGITNTVSQSTVYGAPYFIHWNSHLVIFLITLCASCIAIVIRFTLFYFTIPNYKIVVQRLVQRQKEVWPCEDMDAFRLEKYN